MGVSFNPDTFTKGGLIQDVDVEIVGGEATLVPPENYPAKDRVFIQLDLKVLDTDEETTQHWSAGKNTDFTPSADGDEIVPSGSRESLNDNSNWSIFCQNLANCNFPKAKLDGKVSSLVGTQIHVVRIPSPEREGLTGGKKDGDRKQTILVPNKLIKLPGEKAKTRAGRKTAGAAAPAAEQAAAPATAAAEGLDAETLALMAVSDILKDAQAAMPVPVLKAAVIRKHIQTPTELRNQVVAKAGDQTWLAAQGFTVEAGLVQPLAA